jgi:hypothetical protein
MFHVFLVDLEPWWLKCFDCSYAATGLLDIRVLGIGAWMLRS